MNLSHCGTEDVRGPEVRPAHPSHGDLPVGRDSGSQRIAEWIRHRAASQSEGITPPFFQPQTGKPYTEAIDSANVPV